MTQPKIHCVADIMTPLNKLVTFTPDTGIHKAIHALVKKRLSGAPVLDAGGSVVGVLSKKDCLKIAFSSRYHADHGGKVGEYMSSPAVTLDAGMDLASASQHFLESHYRRFPVIEASNDGKLVGQVSRHDVLRALMDQ